MVSRARKNGRNGKAIRYAVAGLGHIAQAALELDCRLQPRSWGTLSFRLLGTYIKDLITIDSVGPANRAGQTGVQTGATPGLPRWTANGTVTYDRGPFSFTVDSRYRLLEVSGTEIERFGAVYKVLDREPPVLPANGAGTNTILFDPLGRTYRLGVRFKY